MAKKNETLEAETVETVETVEETTVEETVEETIDLTGFEAAVESAKANADETTGTVPEADVAKVREVYQALPGIKPKNAAKAYLSDALGEAVKSGDLVAARVIMTLTEEAAVAGKTSAPAKVIDPSEAFRTKVATLTLAGFLAVQDRPEGVSEDVVTEAQTLASDLFAEALAVYQGTEGAESESPIVKAAIKAAQSKVRKSGQGRVSSTGERRDLGAHIIEAFEAAEVGDFLSVADIRKFESTVYGTDHPSAGAITNRLEPKSGKPTTIEGIEVGRVDGKLGATKVA